MKCSVLHTNGRDTTGPANPFVVESPEKLSPKEIIDLFIESYTRIETVKKRKHTFVWGSRGSGKSMMLRYLEPQCQAIVSGGFEAFFDHRADHFFAVFMPCKEGQFNKTELELLGNNASLIITEHMLNLSIADRIINCFKKQIPEHSVEKTELIGFSENVVRLFDKAAIASSLNKTNEKFNSSNNPLDWLQELFLNESRKVSAFLRNIVVQSGVVPYEGATSGYHDFLLPFIRYFKDVSFLRAAPIYLMIDDADKLSKAQQSILNSWIANRDHNVVCIKIGARREGYKTFKTKDGGVIEQPHDYSEIDVDELYTQSKSDYSKKVKLIAERRLILANSTVADIDKFLPTDSNEQRLLERLKRETANEWLEVGKPGRQGDYVNRYASARLFQHLKKTKGKKSYAGFQNMVHLSSGIIRDFLEPCYLMFDKSVSKNQNPLEVGFIEASIQDEVLFRYSEYLLLTKFDDIRKELAPENWSHLEKLRRLVESLGRLFYERLHDEEAREARIFSFTIRGQNVPEDIEAVLRLGVEHRFFQLRTYSSKEGGGREYWYILNRRLCPVYKLDPTGFEGRISLTPSYMQLALEDPDKFVRMRLKKGSKKDSDPKQGKLFSLVDGEDR